MNDRIRCWLAPLPRPLRRILVLVIGSTVLTAGALMLVLPGPGILVIIVGLGLMSRSGALWSFIVGMVLIVLDALLLVWVQDWAAVAFHALALFFVIRGFQAARQLATLRTAAALPSGTVPPITPR